MGESSPEARQPSTRSTNRVAAKASIYVQICANAHQILPTGPLNWVDIYYDVEINNSNSQGWKRKLCYHSLQCKANEKKGDAAEQAQISCR